MGDKTGIQWADATWNPIGGCSIVSEGCFNCYAQSLAARFASGGNKHYEGLAEFKSGKPHWTNKIRLYDYMLDKPIRWRKPRMIFVNSMSDMYHNDVPIDYIQQIFHVMNQADQHIYQILTKRALRLLLLDKSLTWSPHIWQGVSIENEDTTFRIDYLRETSAHVKFLSIEPLLERIVKPDLTGIDWVIIGGESGNGARHMSPSWVMDLIEDCRGQGVAVFVKQMGKVWALAHSSDNKGENMDDWPEELRIREFPEHKLA